MKGGDEEIRVGVRVNAGRGRMAVGNKEEPTREKTSSLIKIDTRRGRGEELETEGRIRPRERGKESINSLTRTKPPGPSPRGEKSRRPHKLNIKEERRDRDLRGSEGEKGKKDV